MTIYITLNEIRNNHPDGRPCKEGWTKLLQGLGKTEADDEPFPITFVMENNGLDDALWCVECLRGQDYAVYNLKADIAESVLNIFEQERPDDTRVRDCITATRAFAKKELNDAQSAARSAARAVACGAARDAARAAARAAARDDEWDPAWDSAWSSERDKQVRMFRKWFG